MKRGIDKEVLLLALTRPVTIHYAARRLGVSKTAVWKALHRLERRGLVRQVRIGDGVYWIAHEAALLALIHCRDLPHSLAARCGGGAARRQPRP